MSQQRNAIRLVLRVSGRQEDVRLLALPLFAGFGGQFVLSPRHESLVGQPDSWWYLENDVIDQDSTEPWIAGMLDRILAHLGAARSALADPRLKVEMDCTVSIQTERPLIEISPHAIACLNQLGASFSVEVHDEQD